jgi:hypothetical protein
VRRATSPERHGQQGDVIAADLVRQLARLAQLLAAEPLGLLDVLLGRQLHPGGIGLLDPEPVLVRFRLAHGDVVAAIGEQHDRPARRILAIGRDLGRSVGEGLPPRRQRVDEVGVDPVVEVGELVE